MKKQKRKTGPVQVISTAVLVTAATATAQAQLPSTEAGASKKQATEHVRPLTAQESALTVLPPSEIH